VPKVVLITVDDKLLSVVHGADVDVIMIKCDRTEAMLSDQKISENLLKLWEGRRK